MDKSLAFAVLYQVRNCGYKAGRYIYIPFWRNQLIDIEASKMGIQVTAELREAVEEQLKQAWQRIIQ